MLEKMKEGLQRSVGMTDEDFEVLVQFPHATKMGPKIHELMQYKIIAEAVTSKYCSAGLKVGQKFTFNAMPAVFLPEESDAPPCVRALGPIADQVKGFWDRIIEGLDPNGGLWQMTECQDPGFDRGGLGHVVFKVYAQKIE
jgi:hypothetical protein